MLGPVQNGKEVSVKRVEVVGGSAAVEQVSEVREDLVIKGFVI